MVPRAAGWDGAEAGRYPFRCYCPTRVRSAGGSGRVPRSDHARTQGWNSGGAARRLKAVGSILALLPGLVVAIAAYWAVRKWGRWDPWL
jgi:hypothetical protein